MRLIDRLSSSSTLHCSAAAAAPFCAQHQTTAQRRHACKNESFPLAAGGQKAKRGAGESTTTHAISSTNLEVLRRARSPTRGALRAFSPRRAHKNLPSFSSHNTSKHRALDHKTHESSHTQPHTAHESSISFFLFLAPGGHPPPPPQTPSSPRPINHGLGLSAPRGPGQHGSDAARGRVERAPRAGAGPVPGDMVRERERSGACLTQLDDTHPMAHRSARRGVRSVPRPQRKNAHARTLHFGWDGGEGIAAGGQREVFFLASKPPKGPSPPSLLVPASLRCDRANGPACPDQRKAAQMGRSRGSAAAMHPGA